MDIRQLNALIAVADNGSFSAAARALHTVQSNISTHVARLEHELDVTLIDRANSSLTEEGTVVIERARRILAELDALQADVASLHDELAGSVRIGVIGTTGRWLVPLLFDEATRQHPKVHLSIIDATTTSLLPQVAAGALDWAVVNLPVDDPELRATPLFDEKLMVIAPVGDDLAAFERITLEDLAKHRLVLAAEGTAFRQRLDADAARVGVRLKSKADVDGMRLVASLAFQGFGAAVVPASAVPGWLDPGDVWRRIPLEGPDPRTVGVVQRRRGRLSTPADALRDILTQVVADHAGTLSGITVAVDDVDHRTPPERSKAARKDRSDSRRRPRAHTAR